MSSAPPPDGDPDPPRVVAAQRLPRAELRMLARVLRTETVGGALLLFAAVAALVWANTPGQEAYEDLREFVIGPSALHLDLQLQTWAGEGLLAIFFFVAGLELKRELVVGQLRRPADAAIPVVAAVAGMVVPAAVYFATTAHEPGVADGWAVPIATDIAFALAVLAVIGSHLPTALRAFLLTLAVVDDLLAIAVIAVFYTDSINLLALGGAVLLLAAYAGLARARVTSALVYVPLALAAWALMHEAGVHATAAGIALGLLTRVRHDPDEHESPAERLEHRVQPISAGVAVPVFAFFAAGVPIGAAALRDVLDDPAALGVVAGLVLGKAVGVGLGTFLTARFTRARLSPELSWWDMAGLSMLAGIGFTVSLLIAELAFPADPERLERIKAAVLIGSLIATVIAAAVLRVREHAYRGLARTRQAAQVRNAGAGPDPGTAQAAD